MSQGHRVSVLGLDSSADLIDVARVNLSAAVSKSTARVDVAFQAGDTASAAFADNAFDVVFSRDAVHHSKVRTTVAVHSQRAENYWTGHVFHRSGLWTCVPLEWLG